MYESFLHNNSNYQSDCTRFAIKIYVYKYHVNICSRKRQCSFIKHSNSINLYYVICLEIRIRNMSGNVGTSFSNTSCEAVFSSVETNRQIPPSCADPRIDDLGMISAFKSYLSRYGCNERCALRHHEKQYLTYMSCKRYHNNSK